MSRLTKYFANKDEYGHNSCLGGCESCNGVMCGDAVEMIKKLAHYEDMEEQGRLIEQKQGKWKLYGKNHYSKIWECSECKGKWDFHTKYCPNCGAKMDEVGNE